MSTMDSREFWDRSAELDSRGSSLEEVNAFISDWMSSVNILKAEMWGFHVTMKFLDLRIQGSGTNRNLHIACAGCRRIQGQTWWESPVIEVVSSNSQDSRILVQDVIAGLFIECSFVRLTTNVPPLFNVPLPYRDSD